jgi:hypothetical protein
LGTLATEIENGNSYLSELLKEENVASNHRNWGADFKKVQD